ncbi:MAG: hypothetical protein BWK72_15530 [Rhodoferax ferrireducens]|uniref:Methyltransferase FkbM domain-containing protein n=1 Tax=Rhodoferax ferrireducens TaxID=192843 RepID=A0A1W9KRQ3_9BURK|nr:MAG: hypothetical protein BWK72_15530 [Rhodoferax ferrireducens]
MINQIDDLYKLLSGPLQDLANRNGIEVKVAAHYLDFIKEKKVIRLSVRHLIYANDIVNSFDYYYTAVLPYDLNGFSLVDYSSPRYHDVAGFDIFPVYFPSLAEPLVTTQQYLDFANLKEGDSVLDLGAYSGLTSIVFKGQVGASGRVLAVDADEKNALAIEKNLMSLKNVLNLHIDTLFGAVWSHCDGLQFSSEGNMGSSASEIVGKSRGDNKMIKSFTLQKIVEIGGFEAVDFIKCDVEGAEAVIFDDHKFFDKFRPRIIIETHLVGGTSTTEKCISDLGKFGYTCELINQTGVTLPLLQCHP